MPTYANGLPDWLVNGFWLVPVAGLIACGAAFLVGWGVFGGRRKPAEEKLPLDADFLQGVTKERRAAPRRKGNTVEVQLSGGEDQPVLKGWVLDRSVGGLCLLVDQAVPESTVLKVRPRSTGDAVPWTEVTVRMCRPEGTQFELGCQFHRTPNWNLLLQFG